MMKDKPSITSQALHGHADLDADADADNNETYVVIDTNTNDYTDTTEHDDVEKACIQSMSFLASLNIDAAFWKGFTHK